MLGLNQRCFTHMDEFEKDQWLCQHREAAERFERFAAMAACRQGNGKRADSPAARPELDDTIILLWPLVKRHNWSYRDFLNVLSQVRQGPDEFIFDREQDLAAHCNNVLGLRKTCDGKTAANGLPEGLEIALLICGSPAA